MNVSNRFAAQASPLIGAVTDMHGMAIAAGLTGVVIGIAALVVSVRRIHQVTVGAEEQAHRMDAQDKRLRRAVKNNLTRA